MVVLVVHGVDVIEDGVNPWKRTDAVATDQILFSIGQGSHHVWPFPRSYTAHSRSSSSSSSRRRFLFERVVKDDAPALNYRMLVAAF